MLPDDPFQHHRELATRIKPAAESFFREMDLDAIDAQVAELGEPPDWRTSCDVREANRKAWLEGRWDDDLWFFGYGSLMWDPSVEFSEVRRARTDAYDRSFCLWDNGGRGSPAQPGLMLAIDEGSGCEGLAFRIPATKIDHETFVLFRREMLLDAYKPMMIPLATDQGEIEALAFVANRAHELIKPDIALAEQARMVAVAEGLLGSNFDYLANVHEQLQSMGIEDPYIAALHDLTQALR